MDWEVALAGKKLSLRELEDLAKLKAPLVKVRGQWVEMNAEEIQAAIQFWKKKASDEISRPRPASVGHRCERCPERIRVQGSQSIRLDRRAARATGSQYVFPRIESTRIILRNAAPLSDSRLFVAVIPAHAGGWARAWPTIWAWAKPFRRWPSYRGTGNPMARSPYCWYAPRPL